MNTRQEILSFLETQGAALEPHRRGPLMEHLKGTARLLEEWNAPEPLVIAGLCHAIYGTDGLARPLVDPGQRQVVREVVGAAAEAIIYFYASCDRLFLYPQFGRVEHPRFRDRFTGREFAPAQREFQQFIDLTWANALDVVVARPEQDWPEVRGLILVTYPLASESARQAAAALLRLDDRTESACTP